MALFKEKPKTEREKVEKRRDEVLARGRKFKYPMQYAKHRLVIQTIIIGLLAIIGMVVIGWLMLYRLQDTGDMVYRITQVIPVPVAEVDGEKVRYSDYLMIYRSNLITAEQQGGQFGSLEEGDMLRADYHQAALSAAIEYTYALKLGRDLGIEVTDEEIDAAFDEHRKVGGIDRSEEGFLKIVKDNFGMTRSEYRRMLYLSLMRAKVAQAVDDSALELAEQIDAQLAGNGGDLRAVADALGEAVVYEETGRLVDNMNVDEGRSDKAMSLEPGQISERFLSNNGDGYYYVKLVEKNDTQVNYVSMKVAFTEFEQMIAELYEQDKVKVYISFDEQDDGGVVETLVE